MRSHPSRDKTEVLLQLFPFRRGKMITDALEMMWSHVILANIAQGLSDEAARPAGQGEIAAGIATEDDLELTELDAGGCTVGVIHHLRGHLGIQPEPIRGHGFGRKDSEIFVSSNGRDNRVGGSPGLAKNRMRAGAIIESPADPANSTVAHQPGKRHPDRARIAKIGEIVRRERPTSPLFGDAPKDLPWVGDRRAGLFHVEKNALFFQQIKSKPVTVVDATSVRFVDLRELMEVSHLGQRSV